LSEVGRALYGEHWPSALSADIAVSDRSVRRWTNGTDQIPWGAWLDVYRRLEARALTLDYWKKELYERVVLRECEHRPLQKFNPEADWLIEANAPRDGRHSKKDQSVFQTLADVKAFMKRHPSMIFRVIMPHGATAKDRVEFGTMNIARL
jgi:hypothetical protein